MHKYDNLVAFMGVFIILISLIGAVAGAGTSDIPPGGGKNYEWVSYTIEEPFNGNTAENSETQKILKIEEERIKEIHATLSWTDEPVGVGGIVRTNEPDEFSISITSPSGLLEETSETSSSGTVNLDITIPEEHQEDRGDWEISVIAGECGDTYGPGGIRLVSQDGGNSWDLEITVVYEQEEEVVDDVLNGAIFLFSPGLGLYTMTASF